MNITTNRTATIVFLDGTTRELQFTECGHLGPTIFVFGCAGGRELHVNLNAVQTIDISGLEVAKHELILPNA